MIEMDTPGGLGSSMRAIVKGILAANVPVVVYVAPSGLERRLGRRGDRDGRRRARDGAADEHRLLDADHDGRRGLLQGSPAQDRQRRVGVHRRAGARERAERGRGSEDGDRGVESRRPRGGAPERGRRPRRRLRLALPPDRRHRAADQARADDRHAPGDDDRANRDVDVEEHPRPPDRPEHRRADALDRADRDRGRALEPRARLPRHRRARSRSSSGSTGSRFSRSPPQVCS